MVRLAPLLLIASAVLATGSACEPDPPTPPDPDVVDTVDVLADLPRHEEQRRALCDRGRVDSVTAAFCTDTAPTVTSMVELLRSLDLEFVGERPDFGLTAHSSSLVMRHVSAANPRAIVMKFPEARDDGAFIAVGYARGDQLVEIAVMPPGGEVDGDIRFYLLRYEQPCNDDGCTLAELLTPTTESGWTQWSLYDDVDLKNTVFDCLQCHQPEGPGTRKHFRMQELNNPWTHWLASFNDGGRALYADYRAVHGGEQYGGIPGSIIGTSSPILVEALIRRSGSAEPFFFDSRIIEDEIVATNPAQPADNSVVGKSPSWTPLYERAVAGLTIPPPFHDVKITDATKLSTMTRAYRDVVNGARSDLPDIRDVFSDAAIEGMSVLPKPGLDAKGIFAHACAQCHNSKLDQEQSRANFNAFDVDNLTEQQRDVIADRLLLPANNRFRMPPAQFRDLRDEDVQTLLDFLER